MADTSPDQDLDLSLLYEIADGSTDFIVESIDMFLLHTPEQLNQIGEAVAIKDWTAAYAGAHKLKPTLGFFGMPISEAMINDFERLAKIPGSDPDILTLKFGEINSLISTNLAALTKIKEELLGE